MRYTVSLEDSVGSSVLNESSDHLYTVHSGLTSSTNYTIRVKASSIAGITETRQPIFIRELLSVCSTTQVVTNEECLCNTTQTAIGEFILIRFCNTQYEDLKWLSLA